VIGESRNRKPGRGGASLVSYDDGPQSRLSMTTTSIPEALRRQDRRQVRALAHALADEMVKALGLRPGLWTRAVVKPLFRSGLDRFSRLGLAFDQVACAEGFHSASRWVLPTFFQSVDVVARGRIPEGGPLLVLSNHPGVADSLAIAAHLPRPDVRIVASGLPFLRALPATAQFLIFTTLDVHERMSTLRRVVRELRDHRAVILFPSGGIDPDPEALPGAEGALHSWSKSVGIILRAVPRTQVLLTVVSGVLSTAALRHPLARLRDSLRDRQRLAEMVQVIRQMIRPGRMGTRGRLSLGVPFPASELPLSLDAGTVTQAIVERARALLAEHVNRLPAETAPAAARRSTSAA
jgi:1-acyl-sn-glycerol-3-phosphate acyltransferase